MPKSIECRRQHFRKLSQVFQGMRLSRGTEAKVELQHWMEAKVLIGGGSVVRIHSETLMASGWDSLAYLCICVCTYMPMCTRGRGK